MNELQKILESLALKITQRTGMRKEYHFEITKGIDDDYDIAITRGNPPIIYVNYYTIVDCISEKKKHKLVGLLEKALDKVPRMIHTLDNLNPPESIGLRKSATKWIRSHSFDAFVILISDKLFKTTMKVTVTVTDSLTNTSVTLEGSDPKKLEYTAKQRLAQMIIEMDIQEQVAEALQIADKMSKQLPDTVIIKSSEDTEITKNEY